MSRIPSSERVRTVEETGVAGVKPVLRRSPPNINKKGVFSLHTIDHMRIANAFPHDYSFERSGRSPRFLAGRTSVPSRRAYPTGWTLAQASSFPSVQLHGLG